MKQNNLAKVLSLALCSVAILLCGFSFFGYNPLTSKAEALCESDVIIDISEETLLGELPNNIADEAFVLVENFIPQVDVDLKYGTTDNITGQALYDFDDAYLRYGTVKKLKIACDILVDQGYSLKIWDAYRPVSAQFSLWDAMPDATYIANPYEGNSDHSRGNCVDVTLMTLDGVEVKMPTGFDDFSPLADRDYSDVEGKAASSASILEDAMTAAGFTPYTGEWWHFTDEVQYPVEEEFTPPAANEIQVSAVGDCVLSTGYGFNYENSFEYYLQELGHGHGYFFSQVQGILRNDDLTIANSENVFTQEESRVNKDSQGDRAFWFKSDPSYTDIYSLGSVEAVNVANNHSHDYGKKGYADSLKALSDQGIATFGYGNISYVEVKGYTVAMVGINTLGPLEEGRTMAEVKAELTQAMAQAQKNADVVIVSFHWGEENVSEPNESQRELAHEAVDMGADLILGHHPHVVQEVEVYKGVPIAYSLGNFVFGGNRSPERETIILSATFTIDESSNISVEHQIHNAYVFGEGETNNYQPILAD